MILILLHFHVILRNRIVYCKNKCFDGKTTGASISSETTFTIVVNELSKQEKLDNTQATVSQYRHLGFAYFKY
jgi:hypothetical protein